MAEAVDDIELEDLNREQEVENNEEEEDTGFNDNSFLFFYENPNITRLHNLDSRQHNLNSKLEIARNRDIRRNAGVMKRQIIDDQKQFLRAGLGYTINKGDGPNSTLLYDELRITFKKNGEISGAKYKGKKILISKNEIISYSKNKAISQYVNEFKELLKKADAEHQRTSAVLVEGREGVDLPQNVMDDIISNVSDRLESSLDEIVEDIEENTVITTNELRELRGIIYVRWYRKS